ncbi:MAG: hypothetical protein ACXABY_02555 [Candidatus Thorarchaeota archaeon]|jgi:hypothetical protein
MKLTPLNATFDLKGNILVIQTEFHDNGAKDPATTTLPVTIEISPIGMNVQPTNMEDYYGDGDFPRETWIEFYEQVFKTHVWDGSEDDPISTTTMLDRS